MRNGVGWWWWLVVVVGGWRRFVQDACWVDLRAHGSMAHSGPKWSIRTVPKGE